MYTCNKSILFMNFLAVKISSKYLETFRSMDLLQSNDDGPKRRYFDDIFTARKFMNGFSFIRSNEPLQSCIHVF